MGRLSDRRFHYLANIEARGFRPEALDYRLEQLSNLQYRYLLRYQQAIDLTRQLQLTQLLVGGRRVGRARRM